MITAGTLALRVVADGTGRTRAADMQQRYPQRMTTPLYHDEAFPDAAMVCVQSPSGGTFSDDDLTTTVHAEPGSHLRLTTQAATQVFAGRGLGSRHRINFRVDADATLEYLPKTLIPHTGSCFTQLMDVDVDSSGRYLGWEALAAGRIGHGERFGYRSYDSTVRVSVSGRTVARDLVLLEPPSAARLVGADYLATLLVVAPSADVEALLNAVRFALASAPVCGGASQLPSTVGILVRMTTDHAPDLHRTQQALLNVIRGRVLMP
jgi:urease accessory protein